MSKFNVSYAYNVPHYFDFVIEAKSEAEAEIIAEKWLKQCEETGNLFTNSFQLPDAEAQANYENAEGHRVFTSGKFDKKYGIPPILDPMTGIFRDQEED